MEKDKKFPQQDAPLKNTDNAFVKVTHDGSPQVPNIKETREEKNPEDRKGNDKKP